jgi:DNA topoisomerase-1
MSESKFKKKIKTDEGNTVYVYSEKQVEHRHREKAKRLEKLQGQIGKIRDQVARDLKSKDEKARQTALAVGLIDHTYERVGNDDSADNGHFGVTGWEKQHCKFSGGSATLSYVGKSGVKHTKRVTDAKLVSALKAMVEGKKDTDQILDQVKAEDVNQFLKPYKTTAKDLRGFHANREMRERLGKARKGKLPTDPKKREKALKDEWKKALDETAEAVGHEAATLDGQYLVPGLKDTYLKDGTIQPVGGYKKKAMARVAFRFLMDTFSGNH